MELRLSATVLLSPVLGFAHLFGAAWLSLVLFGFAGGIEPQGQWTRVGGIDYAWTNLAWLPGGLLLRAEGPLGAVGLLLMMAGSGVALGSRHLLHSASLDHVRAMRVSVEATLNSS